MKAWHEREMMPRRWRKFEAQPIDPLDFPFRDWQGDSPRYSESPGDPIICYDSCNGYSLWHSDEMPPPAQQWIAMPKRPKRRPQFA